MKRWQYNCLIWHVAIFIRAPILLTLQTIARIGYWAEEMKHRAGHIPDLRP